MEKDIKEIKEHLLKEELLVAYEEFYSQVYDYTDNPFLLSSSDRIEYLKTTLTNLKKEGDTI